VKINWLKRKITVEEAEAKHMVLHDSLGKDPVPFGFINNDWNKLKQQMVDGDELWEYSSPADTWENLCGRAGIALVRGGKVVDAIQTVMN
jgi:hypothetical protein